MQWTRKLATSLKDVSITSKNYCWRSRYYYCKGFEVKRKSISDISSAKRNRELKNEDLSCNLENSNEILNGERHLNCNVDKDSDEILRDIVHTK